MAALVEAARAPDFPRRSRWSSPTSAARRRPCARARRRASRRRRSIASIFAGRDEFEASMQALLDAHRIELDLPRRLHAHAGRALRRALARPHASTSIPRCCRRCAGCDTHERALAAGVKEHGCTVHFVEPELDAGPIIAQAQRRGAADDDAETLAARVLVEEHKLYPRALAEVAAKLRRAVAGPPRRLATPGRPARRSWRRCGFVTELSEGWRRREAGAGRASGGRRG